MADQITLDDLQKAARNLERLAVFVGERRSWILAEGCEEPALATRETAQSLIDLLSGWDTDADDTVPTARPPQLLEPAAKISAGRMSKFSDFLGQLHGWFESHQDCDMPPDSSAALLEIRASLALTAASLTELLGPAAAFGKTQPIALGDGGEADRSLEEEFGPLTSPDLGPVAEVDMRARLILEDTVQSPLMHEFRGVMELTKETKSKVEEFFANQGVTYEGQELRRVHDKVLKWVEGIPEGRVLVIKLSGLTGTPQPYSSYQPRESLKAGEAPRE
jgi:hypothetical protein